MDVTRIEKFLGPIRNIVQGISEGHTRPKPISREEHYLDDIATALEAGGGGTSDYSDLDNKPSINGVTLTGDKSLADLGSRFVINIQENLGVWSADKTGAEIKAAEAAGKTVTLSFGGAEIPLLFNTFSDVTEMAVFGLTTINPLTGARVTSRFTLTVGDPDDWNVVTDTKYYPMNVSMDIRQDLLAVVLNDFMTFIQTAVAAEDYTVARYQHSSLAPSVADNVNAFFQDVEAAQTYGKTPCLLTINNENIPFGYAYDSATAQGHISFHLGGVNGDMGVLVVFSGDLLIDYETSPQVAFNIIISGNAKILS